MISERWLLEKNISKHLLVLIYLLTQQMVDGPSQPFLSADITHTPLYSCSALVIFCISKENIFSSRKKLLPTFCKFQERKWLSMVSNKKECKFYSLLGYHVWCKYIANNFTIYIENQEENHCQWSGINIVLTSRIKLLHI